jgi:hypothetical protein
VQDVGRHFQAQMLCARRIGRTEKQGCGRIITPRSGEGSASIVGAIADGI